MPDKTSRRAGSLLAAQIILCFFLLAFFLPSFSAAQTEEEEEVCEDSVVGIVARDPRGGFIPNISVEIYEEETDADGNLVPGKKIAGGKTDPTLGYFQYIFKGKTARGALVVKMWDRNKNIGSFLFTGGLYVGCGESITYEEYLSGLDIVLRDNEGGLIRNTDFSIYTQRYDADGEPIREKKDFVAKLNTTAVGGAKLYVSAGRENLNNRENDYYVFELPGRQGGAYLLYDIGVSPGSLTQIEYLLSGLEIILTDEEGVYFPANTKIEIFRQVYDADDNPALGASVKDILTDDRGTAALEYPAGLYAARVMGKDNKYEYFYDLEIVDQQWEIYELTPGEDWRPAADACAASSNITVITQDLAGKAAGGLNFELYAVDYDADGGAAKNKLAGGRTDEFGRGAITAHPSPLRKYALKLYGLNASAGDYWFFEDWQFACGENKTIEKDLPVLDIILRDGYGNLLKNQKFSIHTQKFDVDGQPIKEKKDLVSADLTTGETGGVRLFLSPDHPYDPVKRGLYVFSTIGSSKAEYNQYDIGIAGDEDSFLEYQLSDVVFEVKNAANQALSGQAVEVYAQAQNAGGYLELGKRLASGKTDAHGMVRFEYPAGYYAAVIKDDFGQNNIFWQQQIKPRQRNHLALTAGLVRAKVRDSGGNYLPAGTTVTVYALKKDENDEYYKDKKLKAVKIANTGYAEIALAPESYLFTALFEKNEYGRPLYAENGKIHDMVIDLRPDNIVISGKRYRLSAPASAQSLADRLKGRILLQVEARGEAWYVDINSRKRYYMKDGATAYEMLRRFGLGITNEDLRKIPVGFDLRFEEPDYDGDGLSDKMEEAIGTDMYLRDSDGDGHDDGTEAWHGYDPLGPGRLPVDLAFAERQKGRILLQVESRGEAWYVNPADGRRYYMHNGESAYEIMRFLSLGITNENLNKIEAGSLSQ